MNISFQPSGGDSGTGSEVNSRKKTHQAEKSKPRIEDVKTSEGPLGQVKYPKKKKKIICNTFQLGLFGSMYYLIH